MSEDAMLERRARDMFRRVLVRLDDALDDAPAEH